MTDNTTSREIYVYVQDDFAEEMTECTPSTLDDGNIAENDVRARIDEAINIWNQQSTGLALQYGGTVPTNNPNTACSSFAPNRPAVVLTFRQGCRPWQGGCASSIATASAISSDCSSVTVWGDPTDAAVCNGDAREVAMFQESPADLILKRTMVHELGHILGLGHSTGDNQSDFGTDSTPETWKTDDATMALGGNGAGHYHLFSWDKDCVRWIAETFTLGRRTYHYYMWWYDWFYWPLEKHTYPTQRAAVSGGALDDYYGLHDSAGWLDYVARPGPLVRPSFSSSVGLDSVLLDQHVAPTYWSPYGVLSSPHRAFVLDEGYPSGGTIQDYDPPRVRSVSSSNLFATANSTTLYYRSGFLTYPVVTNVPASVAFDPESEQPIVAWVNTTKPSSAANLGTINVHAGFYSSNTLNSGSALHTSGTSYPYSANHPAGFDYELTTNSRVGVACADDTWSHAYNCILAWQERSVPTGKIGYTHFRVGSGNSIEWRGTAYIRGGSHARTVAGVQAAFAEGKFRLTWKKWLGAQAVVTTESATYTGWSTPISHVASTIIDPPTYLYYSHEPSPTADSNHAVVWTSSE